MSDKATLEYKGKKIELDAGIDDHHHVKDVFQGVLPDLTVFHEEDLFDDVLGYVAIEILVDLLHKDGRSRTAGVGTIEHLVKGEGAHLRYIHVDSLGLCCDLPQGVG